MPSHGGTRARGQRSYDDRAYGRARSGGGRRKGLVRFWPAMALLAVSLTSAWMVGEVKFGSDSQGIVNAGSGQRTAAPTTDTQDSTPPDPGSPEDDAVNGGEQGGAAEAPESNEDGDSEATDDADEAATDRVSTYGPVTSADRDLLAKVTSATLWQQPVSVEAAERASSAKVKDAAAKIAAEQKALSAKAKSAALELAIELPNEPSAEQQGFMAEITEASDDEYDQLFVDRLRAAQGRIFALIGEVRGSTQNSLVRAFAQTANTVILRNMTFLDRTGLVGPGSLPGAPVSPDQGDGGAANTAPEEPPADGGTGRQEGDSAAPTPDQGNLEEGDALQPGDILEEGEANGGADEAPAGGTAPNDQVEQDDPLDLPQGNPAENQAGSVATTPTSSILGTTGDSTGKYVIFAMLAIAGLIFLMGLRGFYRRPR